MTAFYSWRLLLLTFHGKARADHDTMHHVHESPLVMLLPLFVLAVGALLAGKVLYPYFVGDHVETFWGASIASHAAVHAAHHVPSWVPIAPLVAALTGIFLGYVCYLWLAGIPSIVARSLKPIHALFFRKWYVDELYDALFLRPAWALGRGFFKVGDQAMINTLGPDGIAKASRAGSGLLSVLQTGYVYHYAFTMIVAVVALMGWLLLKLKGVI
jgi:NADH-quinone oxidoreductase subunit L